MKPLIEILCAKRVENSIPGRQFLRIGVNVLIDIYLQTRNNQIKDFVFEVSGKVRSDLEFS